MRRHRRERPTIAFSGRELRWMALGIMTLVVLFLLISRLREQGAMGQPADAAQTTAVSQASAPAAPLPEPTGPTDEDPDEAEAAKEELRGLSDGTLNLGSEEMAPYNRLVSWVKNQSFARLWARAKKGLAYTYLHDDAPKHRGQLVALDVEIRLVRDAGKNDAGIPLSEAWATTKESGNHLYDLIVVDFPAKMPVGVAIRERAKFAGYFLKIQGHESGMAKPGQPPEKAPLLIGRIEWKPIAAPSRTDGSREWIWALAALAIVVLALAARFVFWTRKRGGAVVHPSILAPPSDGVIPVELWLEQCGPVSHKGGDQDENNEYLDGGDRRNDRGGASPPIGP